MALKVQSSTSSFLSPPSIGGILKSLECPCCHYFPQDYHIHTVPILLLKNLYQNEAFHHFLVVLSSSNCPSLALWWKSAVEFAIHFLNSATWVWHFLQSRWSAMQSWKVQNKISRNMLIMYLSTTYRFNKAVANFTEFFVNPDWKLYYKKYYLKKKCHFTLTLWFY